MVVVSVVLTAFEQLKRAIVACLALHCHSSSASLPSAAAAAGLLSSNEKVESVFSFARTVVVQACHLPPDCEMNDPSERQVSELRPPVEMTTPATTRGAPQKTLEKMHLFEGDCSRPPLAQSLFTGRQSVSRGRPLPKFSCKLELGLLPRASSILDDFPQGLAKKDRRKERGGNWEHDRQTDRLRRS